MTNQDVAALSRGGRTAGTIDTLHQAVTAFGRGGRTATARAELAHQRQPDGGIAGRHARKRGRSEADS